MKLLTLINLLVAFQFDRIIVNAILLLRYDTTIPFHMLIFNKRFDDSVRSMIISHDSASRHIERARNIKAGGAYVSNKEQRIFIAPLAFRTNGRRQQQGTGGRKAAGKLRADENDNASRAHVRRFPSPPPLVSFLPSPLTVLRLLR